MKGNLLERKLKLRFKNGRMLDQALAHPSYLNEIHPGEKPVGSYERLEFLGDAMLGLAVTLELFKRCPELSEGRLTKLRSSIVRGKTLARVARDLDLGQHLKMGRGEESTGGRDRESNLAAALEALVGAVLLDRGHEAARKFVLGMMAEELDRALAVGAPEDPKSRLQELVQVSGGAPPVYRLVESGGPDHDKSFQMEVMTDGNVLGKGQGKRKLEAENRAALEALKQLTPDGER